MIIFDFEYLFPFQNDAICHPCPAGQSCTAYSTSNCTAGQYSIYGDPDCHDCDAGYACPLTDQAPVKCQPGQHTGALQAQTECSNCTAGYYCPDTAYVF